MNILETYVTNITNVKESNDKKRGLCLYKVTADYNCYGAKDIQIEKSLSKEQYEQVRRDGYYMS